MSGVGLGWVSLDWFGWFGWFDGLVVRLVLWFFVWMENARDEMAQRRLYFLVTQQVLVFFWCQMCFRLLSLPLLFSQSRSGLILSRSWPEAVAIPACNFGRGNCVQQMKGSAFSFFAWDTQISNNLEP